MFEISDYVMSLQNFPMVKSFLLGLTSTFYFDSIKHPTPSPLEALFDQKHKKFLLKKIQYLQLFCHSN